MPTPRVAFICVHNSCRSQIAEAFARRDYAEVFEAYSAGTELKTRINADAVRILKSTYDIDMEKSQHPKLLTDLPDIDIVITMGCNVSCPYLPCRHREDWGLEDPTGQEDAVFMSVIETIRTKLDNLAHRISCGDI
ncbi:arsenate reductase ArsC [Alloscardovia criceti]|uniref:arsenate reductase ArsC n=1 Tax=Alloscardovia criceti TaxID=356828 RepID=UPI0003776EEF|nr:arsenate reductase ArsC [Alloscardovia criceti]